MDTLYEDLIHIINETIINHNLEDKNYQELLDLDIIEYIYLVISQIHHINYKSYEEIIREYLKYFVKDKQNNSLLYEFKENANLEKNNIDIIDNKLNVDKELNDSKELNIDTNENIRESQELSNIINIDIENKNTINKQNNFNLEIDNLIKSKNQNIEVSDLTIKVNNLGERDNIGKLSTQEQYILDNQEFINLDINIITNKLNKLKNIILPEQRTKEWYEYRHNMITASDLYKVLGTEGGRRDLIIKKCSPIDPNKKVGGGDACRHGIKYEPLATKIYELRNNVTILDFGCIPHQDNLIPFGASPDGIVSEDNHFYAGRMLEIKCPYSRIITGKVPEMYWKQVQGQLEVCDLEVCDFLECKFEEYSNEEDFYQDGEEYKTSLGNEKGIIIVFSNNSQVIEYSYCPIGQSRYKNDKWIEEETDKVLKNENLNFIGITYWKLSIFSCVLIHRNRDWFKEITPKIIEFWKEIESYKKKGIDDLIAKKRTRVKKVLNLNDECLID